MRPKNYFQRNGAIGIFLLATLTLLTSCGSYEYVPYNDGIYSEADTRTRTNHEAAPRTSNENSNYYSSYFAEKSAQIDNAIEQEEIFTDVDSYSNENYDQADTTATALNYERSNPSWGSNYDDVQVNIYSTGYGFGWGWNNWYGPGWGWNGGWNNWYGPGWGWNGGWGLNIGWGWNNWYGNGFWCPPYYRYGYGYPFYNNRAIAYNRGFRNGYATNYRSRGYRAGLNRSRSTYSNRSRSTYSGNRSRSTYSSRNRGDYSRRRVSADNTSRSRTSRYSNPNNTYRSRSRSGSSINRSGSSNGTRTRNYSGGSRSRSNSSGSRNYSGSRSRSSSSGYRSSGSSSRSRSSGGGSRSRSRGRG